MLSMWYRARVNQFGELVIPQPSSVRQGTSLAGPRLERLPGSCSRTKLGPHATNQPTTNNGRVVLPHRRLGHPSRHHDLAHHLPPPGARPVAVRHNTHRTHRTRTAAQRTPHTPHTHTHTHAHAAHAAHTHCAQRRFVDGPRLMGRCWFEDDYWTFLFLGFVALSCLYCLGVYCLALFKYRTRLYDAGTPTARHTRHTHGARVSPYFSLGACAVVCACACVRSCCMVRAGTYSDIQRSKRTEIKFRVTGYLLAFLITWVLTTSQEIGVCGVCGVWLTHSNVRVRVRVR
jgi:hypothetical protein